MLPNTIGICVRILFHGVKRKYDVLRGECLPVCPFCIVSQIHRQRLIIIGKMIVGSEQVERMPTNCIKIEQGLIYVAQRSGQTARGIWVEVVRVSSLRTGADN